MDQSVKDLILREAIKKLSTLKDVLIHQLGMEEKDLTEEERGYIINKTCEVLNTKGE